MNHTLSIWDKRFIHRFPYNVVDATEKSQKQTAKNLHKYRPGVQTHRVCSEPVGDFLPYQGR